MFLNVTESIKSVSENFSSKEELKKKEYKIIRGDSFSKREECFEEPDKNVFLTQIKNISPNNIRGHYNVEAKIVQFLHNIHSKDGMMNILILEDRNGGTI